MTSEQLIAEARALATYSSPIRARTLIAELADAALDLLTQLAAATAENERLTTALRGLLDNPTATAWSCSARCWQEGGPHDETCHPIESQAQHVAREALIGLPAEESET